MTNRLNRYRLERKRQKSKQPKKQLAPGCLAFLALPFAAISIYVAWTLASMLWFGYKAKSWDVVTAEIIQVELKTTQGESNANYQVLAEYQYEYQGQRYDNDRVGLLEQKDGFGLYHKSLYESLKEAEKRDKRVDCYVDPKDPTRALLDRKIRPELVIFKFPFVFGFGIIGFGMLGGSVYVSRQQAIIAKLKHEHPQEPWLWREDWKRGTIDSTSYRKLLYFILFTLLWNAISILFPLPIWFDDQKIIWWKILLIMIFPVIGIGMIFYMISMFFRWRKFGVSTLRLGHMPGVIGGKFSGVVFASQTLSNVKRVSSKLVCTQLVPSGDDTREEVLWQETRTLNQTLSTDQENRLGIPVVFIIPSECRSTNSEEQIAWKLRVQAKTKGLDFDEEFEVPIFKTEDSREGIEIDDEPLSSHEIVPSLVEQLTDQEILVEALGTSDGVRYTSPIGRNVGTSMAMTLFTLVFGGAMVLMYFEKVWFFFAVLSFFGIIFALLTIESWLGSSELYIRGNLWRARSGWYGIRRTSTEFSASDISLIDSKKKLASGAGTNQTQWVNLVAQLADGKEITLVRHVLAGTSERQLLAELRQRAGLGEEGNPGGKNGETDLWDYVN